MVYFQAEMFIQYTLKSVVLTGWRRHPVLEMYTNSFNKKRCFVSHELILLAGKLSPFEFVVETACNSVCCFLCRKYIFLHLSVAYLNSPSWRWPGPNTFSTKPFKKFDFSSTSSCLSCFSGIVSLMSYIPRSAGREGGDKKRGVRWMLSLEVITLCPF